MIRRRPSLAARLFRPESVGPVVALLLVLVSLGVLRTLVAWANGLAMEVLR